MPGHRRGQAMGGSNANNNNSNNNNRNNHYNRMSWLT
jgi:hypothetical protein